MRRILFIIYYLIFTICTVKADWVQVNNGLGTRSVNTLCTYTSGGVNYIFAGTLYSAGSGVFVSTNDGNSWSLSLSIPNDIWALANTGNYIFAGTGNGLAYSSNNGANWYNGGLGHWVYSLTANGSYVYAGCRWQSFDPGGVYISSNYGSNWTRTSHPDAEINGIAVNGNYIYSAAGGGQNLVTGVFKSSDSGSNWNQSLVNNANIISVLINGSYIFAGTDGIGVYLSTNNGSSWSQTSLNNATITALQIYTNIVFAGGGGFFVSTDNGTTWVSRIEGNVSPIEALSISNGYIFAGTSGGGISRRPLSELVGINTISEQVPASFELRQNYPNPFNPYTKIQFSVSKRSYVELRIYDVLGKLKELPLSQYVNASEYELTLDCSAYSSGTYFYQLIADGNIIDTKKFIVLK